MNIGIEPPDSSRIPPFAILESWINPNLESASTSLMKIGRKLQSQYEIIHPHAKYYQILDPSDSKINLFSLKARKRASMDRILFHYNGRGVPSPTSNGEIWVFNEVKKKKKSKKKTAKNR